MSVMYKTLGKEKWSTVGQSRGPDAILLVIIVKIFLS